MAIVLENSLAQYTSLSIEEILFVSAWVVESHNLAIAREWTVAQVINSVLFLNKRGAAGVFVKSEFSDKGEGLMRRIIDFYG